MSWTPFSRRQHAARPSTGASMARVVIVTAIPTRTLRNWKSNYAPEHTCLAQITSCLTTSTPGMMLFDSSIARTVRRTSGISDWTTAGSRSLHLRDARWIRPPTGFLPNDTDRNRHLLHSVCRYGKFNGGTDSRVSDRGRVSHTGSGWI